MSVYSLSRRSSWITVVRATMKRGDVMSMDTQITNKRGFADNFWVHMAALVILTVVVITVAAKYVW